MIIAKEKTKKIIINSILVSLAVILSICDKLISQIAFPFLPTAKIGLANIIVIFSLYKYDFKDSLILVILKSVFVGLILGSVVTFVISFFSSLFSFFAMFIIKKLAKDKISCVGISTVGGFIHIVVQLIIVSVLYQIKDAIIYYGFFLLLASLVTSVIIGLISNRLISNLNRINE